MAIAPISPLRKIRTVNPFHDASRSNGLFSNIASGRRRLQSRPTVLPLPTNLNGTTVKVKDSMGAERLAPLFYVGPAQVNYEVPSGTATGEALVTFTSADGTISTGTVNVTAVAPALFSANGDGWSAPGIIVGWGNFQTVLWGIFDRS